MTDKLNVARMLTIATTLGELYQGRSAMNLRENQLKQDVEVRRVYITPPDGWAGKNVEQLDVVRLTAEYQDTMLPGFMAALAELDTMRCVNTAAIEALEAERRAIEWAIRVRLVDALSYSQTQVTNENVAVEYSAFDGVLDEQALAQAEQAIADVDAEVAAETYAAVEKAKADAEADHHDGVGSPADDVMPY